jgi:quercetin dioxygenase-like cupin family protein
MSGADRSDRPATEPRALGWEQIGDAGSLRVVGLRLTAGTRVPEHRNAIPVAVIVTEGTLHFSDGTAVGRVEAGGLLLINPGERHRYWAEVPTSAYMVFAGLPGARARPWSLRQR